MRLRTFIAGIIMVAGVIVAAGIVRFASADASPVISDVVVNSVEATSATVTWTTNEDTDSFVDFSQDTNYCGVRNTGAFNTQHSVVIPNLSPGTSYFFRINSTDQNGNQIFSGNYSLTTSGTPQTPNLPSVSNTQQQTLASNAISAIKNITDAQALTAVQQALNNQASQVVGAPKILGNPQVNIGTDQATFTWNTDQAANGVVYIASAAEYNPSSANPYPRQEQDTADSTEVHSVIVYGLTPDTEYHYKASSQGSLGDAGTSPDLTFTTKAVLPNILNPHLVRVGEHSATVSWGTPLPSAGTVTYEDLDARTSLSVGDPTFLVTHIIQLASLTFQTRYSLVIQATNQGGDIVTSTPLYFVTTKNNTPPIISQVSDDSTLYPGQDTTVQTVVSWQTDEPAECNMSYVSGVSATGSGTESSTLETALLTKHVSVVTNFQPATVYKYWVTCTDADGNTTSSQDFVLLTPQQQKSIIDIIIENFQGTFGWLNGVGGAKK
jgi:hypothetical protein